MQRPSIAAVRRINDFRRAVDTLAFKGARHPDEWGEIDREFKKAEQRLMEYVAELEARVNAKR